MDMRWEREEELRMEKQKNAIFNQEIFMDVVMPCRVEEGIVQLNAERKAYFASRFRNCHKSISFFIPASGSGSRMFQFLYEFLEAPNALNQAETERFFSQITSFALFRKLPLETQEKVLNFEMNVEDFIRFLLEENGMNFGQYPKGLIPFHFNPPFLLNPFQEQLIQGSELTGQPIQFHFTIQLIYEKEFQDAIDLLIQMTGQKYLVSYSEQDPKTDAYIFNEAQETVCDAQGKAILRPAGHGTLLANLSNMESEYVLVKNIDNLQHFTKSKATNIEWEVLIGMLDEVKNQFRELYEQPSKDRFKELNQRYQFISNEELEDIQTDEEWRELINRPLRICGMVRNEGQPGGGPFFVRQNNKIRKQIVEKTQLSTHPNAGNLMMQSTHFNPVMMVLSMKDFQGESYNLEAYKDAGAYIVLEKTLKGKKVKFMENPGLWNGSMAHWNTIFVEIPNEVFTPVKTVLDLLHPAHQSE
jgi:hypothetical protein